MTINDVLPLKAARHDAIANIKCFEALGHQRPNFDGYIYIHYAAPPHSACISSISPSVWQQSFVGRRLLSSVCGGIDISIIPALSLIHI